MTPAAIIETNLRTAMRFFGMATPKAEIRELETTVAMYCGLDYGVFNIALLTEPVRTEAQLAAAIEQTGSYFRELGVRWSFWLCEDLLDARTRRRARTTFASFGQRPILHPPGMMAATLEPPARKLPAVECRPVSDAATRQEFAGITAVTFDIPPGIAQAVYAAELGWKGDYRGFIGYADGRAVSIVAIVAAAGALGVYSLGTRPEFRRKGYGEALMRAALAEVRETGNVDAPVILQSTDAGYALYRRMGFRDVTRFSVFLT
jgi:ribosomal protein S18 acetylase RimI-like enzyme